jgi:putative PIG3 family NAD(P)H quinone oxidoreductase
MTQAEALAETMSAIDPEGPGGPEVLVAVERPVPRPGPGEVLIRVAAAGVNRPDILQRRGLYPPPPGAPSVPGLEVAGTVAALGDGVATWVVGQPVCALLAGGGYAEYAVAPAGQCLPVPAALSMTEAAAMPETLFTVWTNLFERAYAREGEAVLVHGGTSGIGTMAIALGQLFGLKMIVTCGSDAKCASAEELGAARAINYQAADFVAAVRAETEGRGVDIVLDMVGGDYAPRNLECLADDGRHVSIAVQRGATAELNLGKIMRRRLTLTGSTLRPRSVEFKSLVAEELARTVWPHVEAGRLKPVIDRTFALADAADAHRRMEAGDHVGKIVLVVNQPGL